MLLLDLFCGAGGASMGYHQAGFQVLGVDLLPQPAYPFPFLRLDALDLDFLHIDAVHASPPCQHYSRAMTCRPGLAQTYPDLIAPVRALLQRRKIPYIIENVEGAPLEHAVTLCGSMFGLGVRRHRLFETSFPLVAPSVCRHDLQPHPISIFGHDNSYMIQGRRVHVGADAARRAMGIDWMNRDDLAEAIPPAYTTYIGERLLAHLKAL